MEDVCLQGQYAFVIYDSSKRQVFAARDSSGKEPLFAKHEEDNTLAFTNKPLQSWGTSDGGWQEVRIKLDSSSTEASHRRLLAGVYHGLFVGSTLKGA